MRPIPSVLAVSLFATAGAGVLSLAWQDAAPAYRILLLLLCALAMFALSPERLLRGAKDWRFDALYTIGALLACAPLIMRILDIAYGLLAWRYLLPCGVLLLLVTSSWRSRTAPVVRGGAVWALRQRDGPGFSRDIVSAILALLLPAVILRPMLFLSLRLSTHPLIGALALLLIGLWAWRARGALAHAQALLSTRGVLLAIAGSLLARLTAETMPQALLAMGMISWHGAVASAIAVSLSLLGVALIAFLAVMIWTSLLLLRSTGDHAHLPAWSIPYCACAYLLIAAAVFVPLVHAGAASTGEVDLGLDSQPPADAWLDPASALGVCALVGALVALATHASPDFRRIAPALPFLLGTILACSYAVLAFIAEFLSAGAATSFALQQGWYAGAIGALLLSAAAGLVLILGACGFLYEIVRD